MLCIIGVKMDLLNIGFFKYNSGAIKKNDLGDGTDLGVTTLMDPVGKLLASIDILLAYSTCATVFFLNAFPFSLKLLLLQCKKHLASLMSISVKASFVQCLIHL